MRGSQDPDYPTLEAVDAEHVAGAISFRKGQLTTRVMFSCNMGDGLGSKILGQSFHKHTRRKSCILMYTLEN